DDPAHPLGDRRRDGDLVRTRAEQPCERRACRLCALDPVLPLRAVLVPPREVLVVRGSYAVRERALGARVQVRRVLEDRDLAADRGTDAGDLDGHVPKPTRGYWRPLRRL